VNYTIQIKLPEVFAANPGISLFVALQHVEYIINYTTVGGLSMRET
jgi:hypothetical protein